MNQNTVIYIYIYIYHKGINNQTKLPMIISIKCKFSKNRIILELIAFNLLIEPTNN
jgi:hypothetical protein